MHRRRKRRRANGNPRPTLVTLGAIALLAGDVIQKKGQVFERFPALIATRTRHDGSGGLFVEGGLHQIVGGVGGITERNGIGSSNGMVGHDNGVFLVQMARKKEETVRSPLSVGAEYTPIFAILNPFRV